MFRISFRFRGIQTPPDLNSPRCRLHHVMCSVLQLDFFFFLNERLHVLQLHFFSNEYTAGTFLNGSSVSESVFHDKTQSNFVTWYYIAATVNPLAELLFSLQENNQIYHVIYRTFNSRAHIPSKTLSFRILPTDPRFIGIDEPTNYIFRKEGTMSWAKSQMSPLILGSTPQLRQARFSDQEKKARFSCQDKWLRNANPIQMTMQVNHVSK